MSLTPKEQRVVMWTCRILLSLHLLRMAGAFFSVLQTWQQLHSPLIPQTTIEMISIPYLKAGLCITGSFLVSLWCYFLDQKWLVIGISAASVVFFELLLTIFIE